MVSFLSKTELLFILFAAFTNGFGKAIPNELKINTTIKIIHNGAGKTNAITDKPTRPGKIGIKQRGYTYRLFFQKTIRLRAARYFRDRGDQRVQSAFRLERAAVVKVQVYNMWGRVVQEGTPGYLAPGEHIVVL